MVDFKFDDVADRTTNNYKYTYYPISQELNLTITFHQLLEYNISNIFLEKSYSKSGEEASFRPLYKKSKLSISWDQQPEIL